MIKSLYSGVSGMRNFQTKMDVIANNIANVNTTAFKSGRVRFQDMLSQSVSSAQSPTTTGLGGVNAKQVGLGVKVGSIDTIMTGGALQPTNRDLDFAIEGNGFFAVSANIIKGADASDPTTVGIISYTRDGAFYTDYEGNLVNSNGERVLGYVGDGTYYKTEDPEPDKLDTPDPIDPNATDYLEGLKANLDKLKPLSIPKTIEDPANPGEDLNLESYTIDGTGQIIGVYSDGNSYLLGQVGLVQFNNPEGLVKKGSNNYESSNNSGAPEAGLAGGSGNGVIRQGFVEMSNVDLANEFTEMIITSRAYQANSRSITTSDEMLQELINLKR